MSPWFLWAASQLFCCPGRWILSPHAVLTASQGREKMAPICLPMNAFLRGERLLCFDIFPLDRNLEWGEGSIFEKILPLPSKLKSRAKKKKKISHYYSLLFPDQKQFIKKIQDGKKPSETSYECKCISSDTWWIQSVGEAVWKKNSSLYMLFYNTEIPPTHTHIHTHTHTHRLILYLWAMTVQGCPCWVKTTHLQSSFVNTYIFGGISFIDYLFLCINPIFSFNKVTAWPWFHEWEMEYKKATN